MDGFLVIDHVTRSFGSHCAVDDVSLSIRQGEAFALLGPSGCGKTTLLRMIAGFDRPGSGRIWLDGQDITAQPPERRAVNTVFQNYALFPHLNVWENVAFGLRMSGKPRGEIRQEVERMLAMVRMPEQARKRPAQLSGGQRQRVAIARALVNRPQVLLLDEPLAALDLKLRQHMLTELNAIHAEVGTTFVYVTHDQGEAMSLSDRIAVMNAGRVEQVDAPEKLYEKPQTSFVAGFIGDANFLSGSPVEMQHEGYVRVRIDGFGSPLVRGEYGRRSEAMVRIMVRPEKIHVTRQRPDDERLNVCVGRVEDVSYLGSHRRFQVMAGAQLIVAHVQCSRFHAAEESFAHGCQVWLSFHPDDGRVVPMEESA